MACVFFLVLQRTCWNKAWDNQLDCDKGELKQILSSIRKGNLKKLKHCRALVLREVCIRIGLGEMAFSPEVENALRVTGLKLIPPSSLGT